LGTHPCLQAEHPEAQDLQHLIETPRVSEYNLYFHSKELLKGASRQADLQRSNNMRPTNADIGQFSNENREDAG
jgi:hypothetical protein